MAGGIEVAGLVLGALPLVVEVLKAYTNGISTMGRYLRYKIPLKRLATELDTEYVVYQNTCERLLDGLVDDNEEREALLREPGGLAWKNPGLERELEHRLLRGYGAFVNTMNEIDFAVSEIMKLLKFGPDGKIHGKLHWLHGTDYRSETRFLSIRREGTSTEPCFATLSVPP